MTGLNLFIVSYDIRDQKRLRKVYQTMKEFGTRLHYSVFRCDLNRQGKFELIAAISESINHSEDRVMIVDLGPTGGYTEDRITFLGSEPEEDTRQELIV